MIKVQNKMNQIQEKIISSFYYILKVVASFGISLFFSQCILFENFSPFSLILLATCPNIGLIPTVCYLGSTVGILFNPFNLATFKYITALTMIYVIYMLFQRPFKSVKYDAAIFTAACCFVSGFLFLLVGQLTLFNVLVLAGESVLVCCCVFFVNYAVTAFRKSCHLTSKEIIAASITLVMIFCALHNVYFYSLSIARIFGVFLIFLSLYCLKISHVVVLGTCIGIILSTISNGGEVIFITIVIGTLAGCLFSSFSNKFSMLSFLLVYYSSLIFLGRFPWNFGYFLEPIIASAAVLPVPKGLLRKFLSSYLPVRNPQSGKFAKNEFEEMVEELNRISKKIELAMDCEQAPKTSFDDLEQTILREFKKAGIKAKNAQFSYDQRDFLSGNLSFEDPIEVETKKLIQGILSQHLKVPFLLDYQGDRIKVNEVNNFYIQCSALCRAKENELICGDQAIGFSIDKRKYCLILSDGMGSGRQAGAYSEQTVSMLKRLLQSGMSVSNTLNVLRSIIRFNPKETFSTLDLCIINLENGMADFYKSGAYDSFIIQNDQCIKIAGGGIPLGLSEDDKIIHKSFSISENDFMIMISDGLAVAGENNEFLMECIDDDPQTFAKNIIKKFNNKRDDDITIMICRIQKTKK